MKKLSFHNIKKWSLAACHHLSIEIHTTSLYSFSPQVALFHIFNILWNSKNDDVYWNFHQHSSNQKQSNTSHSKFSTCWNIEKKTSITQENIPNLQSDVMHYIAIWWINSLMFKIGILLRCFFSIIPTFLWKL